MELKELNLTDEQVEAVTKYVQSETDKVRTDYSTKLKNANDELAKYKPVQKSESEIALEKRIAELEAKEKEVTDKERSIQISEKLKAKGLPQELAEFISVSDDVDKSINELGEAVGSYFLNSGYKPTGHESNKGLTKQDFAKMSYMERNKLYQEDPELFAQLNK